MNEVELMRSQKCKLKLKSLPALTRRTTTTTNVRRQKSEEIKFIFDDLSDGVVRSRLKEAIKRSRS
jgi:hypothetical protein